MNDNMDFEAYIRQGEPDKKEKASIWQTAIGLQAVDGLKTSDYLMQTARKHIEGDIDIDQARELIKSYYLSKTVREHINPTDEWKEQPNLDTPASNEQAPYKYPTSTPQVQDKLHTDDPNILRIVQAVGAQELSVKEIMDGIGLKDRKNVLNLYLNPAITGGYIRLLYPDKPRHPRQKYLLTDKGLTLYKKLLGE